MPGHRLPILPVNEETEDLVRSRHDSIEEQHARERDQSRRLAEIERQQAVHHQRESKHIVLSALALVALGISLTELHLSGSMPLSLAEAIAPLAWMLVGASITYFFVHASKAIFHYRQRIALNENKLQTGRIG